MVLEVGNMTDTSNSRCSRLRLPLRFRLRFRCWHGRLKKKQEKVRLDNSIIFTYSSSSGEGGGTMTEK